MVLKFLNFLNVCGINDSLSSTNNMWKEVFYFIAHVGYNSDKLSYRRKLVPKLKISFTVSDLGHIYCPTVRKLCMKYRLSSTESKYEMLFYMCHMSTIMKFNFWSCYEKSI